MAGKGKQRAFYQKTGIKFDCTGCGACCTGDKNDYVFVSEGEARNISVFLGLSWSWFRRRYLRHLDEVGWILTSKPNGDCEFLDASRKCRIYKRRPKQCASYPFWPEVISTARAWREEARRCEGIGRGMEVTPDTIITALNSMNS